MKADIEHFVAEAARAINDRDWEAYGRLFSENLEMQTPGLPGVTIGRQARVALVQGIVAPFPDGQVDLERTITEGDWGCLQLRFSGTHTGPMATPDGGEIPPTNKPVEFPYCLVAKFENGVVTELQEYYDQLAVMTQLGLM